MNTTVAVRDPTLPGLLPDVEAKQLAESFRSYDEGGQLVFDRLPTTVEREVLTRRSEEIGEALKPIGLNAVARADASKIIAGLLVSYGYVRNDPRAAQTVTVYVKHLEDLPLFAIRAACEDVKAGRVYDVDRRTGNRVPLNPDKEPSTVRLHAVAQKHAEALATERWKYDRVLRAKRAIPPPPDEATRKRIAAKFAGLAEDLRANESAEDLERQEVAARLAEKSNAARDKMILAEYARLGVEPIRSGGMLVSPSLAKMTGALVQAPLVDRRPPPDHEA